MACESAYSRPIAQDMNMTTVYTDGGAAPSNPGARRIRRGARER
jgi:hypothetical protein